MSWGTEFSAKVLIKNTAINSVKKHKSVKPEAHPIAFGVGG